MAFSKLDKVCLSLCRGSCQRFAWKELTAKLSTSSCDVGSRFQTSRGIRNKTFKSRPKHVASLNNLSAQNYSIVNNPATNIEKEIIFKSPFPDLHIPDNISLSHYMLDEISKYGDRTALIDGITGEEYSYAKLRDMIIRVSSGLVRMGVRKGDVITIYSPNCIEYVVITLAISAVGAVFSGVNPAYTSEELKHAIRLTKPSILVTVPSLLKDARMALESDLHTAKIILFGEGDGCRPFSTLLDDDMTEFPNNINFNPTDDLAALPFSSGTTGLPKGVMLTHRNLVSNIIQLRQWNTMDYKSAQERLLCVLPLFHIYGKVVIMMAGLASGATIVTLPKFDPEIFMNSIQQHKITFLHLVPPMLLFLAKHPLVDKYDLTSISNMLVGAAPCSSETIEMFLNRMKQQILIRQVKTPAVRKPTELRVLDLVFSGCCHIGYGMTETSPLLHINPPTLNKYQAAGLVVQNTEFKIVDSYTGKTLPVGQTGEIHVRGPQVCKGYYKNQAATDESIVNGWLHTGDIGYADEDEYVTIVDRLKEFIKVKAYQVAPAELEAILVSHPAVFDAAVVGRPNEELGEAPTAFVVLKPNMTVTAEELHQLVAARAAPFKKLAGGIEFTSEIPKSPSGKILRRILKAELLSRRN